MKTLLRLFLMSLLLVQSAQAQNTFTNPILGGDYPDPTILRDGDDYYMTHSSFDYQPGLTVFHSTDLVHWEPISYALKECLGSVWAPDIKKLDGKYYIYFTVSRPSKTNYVVVADSPYGPWSDPIDLKVDHIDPCLIVGETGMRFLVLSGGDRVQLTDDGLSVVPGSMSHIYDGWKFPSNWMTEGFCLEGPKLYHIGEYYYYISAEGGTAGPPTSHMIVVARSKSIDGPWENMPTNPLVHTYSSSDRWWSRGHGSLIDTPDGRWFIVYHAYENGFLNLGRQTLIEPVHFTADGWIVADGGDATNPMHQPLKAWNPINSHSKLGEFRMGLDWRSYKTFEPDRVKVSEGAITLQAKGTSLGSSSPFMFVAGSHRYEIEAEIDIEGDVKAGLALVYDSIFNVGIGFDQSHRYRYRRNEAGRRGTSKGRHLWLRLRNDNHVVTGYWSEDGRLWHLDDWGMEVSGFSHHTLHQFQSLLPGIFAYGEGQATFKNFQYRELSDIEIPTISQVGPQCMPEQIDDVVAPFEMNVPKRPEFPSRSIKARMNSKGLSTTNIQRAIDQMAMAGGGTVVIPDGYWKSGRIVLKSNVCLHISEGATIEFSGEIKDYLPAEFTRIEGIELYSLGAMIYANGEENIAVTGKGKLIGPPADCQILKVSEATAINVDKTVGVMPLEDRIFDTKTNKAVFLPMFIAPINCRNVLIEGVTLERSLFWNVVPQYCDGVIIRGVTVESFGHGRTDGIDIESTRNVLIEYCSLDCGDDTYTMKAGRGEDGVKKGVPTENVVIRHCLAKRGAGGLVCGTETAGGLRNIYMHDCVFEGTDMAFRIKTRRPRGGGLDNVILERIRANVTGEAFYCDMLGSSKWVGELADRLPVREINRLTPDFKNIHISDVIIEHCRTLIDAVGLPERPLRHVKVWNVDASCEQLGRMQDTEDFIIENVNIKTLLPSE